MLDLRDSRVHNYPPRWNAAPSQELLIIRCNHETGVVSLDPLRWGLIPHWCQDQTGGRKPTNAKCETVQMLPMFKEAYRRRRCILPVDGFYEWKAIKGQKAKQPYAIAMRDGKPFGIGGLWENWKDPASGEWIRTFVVITTDANELVAQIHNRMPLIWRLVTTSGGSAMSLIRGTCCDPFQPNQCGCGRSRRASISQNTMIRRSSSQSCWPVLRLNGISGNVNARS